MFQAQKYNFFTIIALMIVGLFISCRDSNGKETAKDIGKKTISVTSGRGTATHTEKASDAGMFYQWNRKIGWSSTIRFFN